MQLDPRGGLDELQPAVRQPEHGPLGDVQDALPSSGGLRGAGDTRWTMVVGVSYAWLLFVPLALTFGYTLEMGVVGAWIGATIYIIIFGLTLFWRFWSKKWMNIKI